MTTIGAFLPGTELAGKVAVVTGASRKLGRAIALALAHGGAAVAVNARVSRDEAEKVAQEIRALGGQAEVFLADVTDAPAVKAMADAVIQRFGHIDILVINAAIRAEVPFLKMSFEEWRRPLTITLDGAFHCTQACLPSMIKSGGGSIVTLGGLSSLSGAAKRCARHGGEKRFARHDARAGA